MQIKILILVEDLLDLVVENFKAHFCELLV
jgi:hypothetical protein